MTDLDYMLRVGKAALLAADEEQARLRGVSFDYSQQAGKNMREKEALRARCDALIKLCTARKPRSRTGAKRDSELHKLLKEYPV